MPSGNFTGDRDKTRCDWVNGTRTSEIPESKDRRHTRKNDPDQRAHFRHDQHPTRREQPNRGQPGQEVSRNSHESSAAHIGTQPPAVRYAK
jgi:hypothetical protein